MAAVLLCFLIPGILLISKLAFSGITFRELFPQKVYQVDYEFAFNGGNAPAWVATYLPVDNAHQTISLEQNHSPNMAFRLDSLSSGQTGRWASKTPINFTQLKYSFIYQGKPVRFDLPKDLPIPTRLPVAMASTRSCRVWTSTISVGPRWTPR